MPRPNHPAHPVLYGIVLFCLGCLSYCTQHQATEPAKPALPKSDYTTLFFDYLRIGDSVYAQKASYQSFANSLTYYDSAQVIADQSGNTLLLAEALFAKGRVYDAWNKDPEQTIRLFQRAASLFQTIPGKYQRYLYVTHLVAHAYDKIKDSTNTTAVLQRMYAELKGKDTALLRTLPFTAEMALISTEVHNYQLADKILRDLTRRSWIKNDPETYDYLNHYYLTQSRLDAFYRKPPYSFYLDSLAQVYACSNNPLDKAYYSDNLAALYAANGRYQQAYVYLSISKRVLDSVNNKNDVNTLQSTLLRSELLAKKQELAYEESLRTSRQVAIWLLGGLLFIITVLSAYLYRRNQKYHQQSVQLDKKVVLVELLNKEIQHRVKNNLYMIYSLLQMQERKTNNEAIVAALQITRLRVESIAALHDQLAKNQERLDFAQYAQRLVTSVGNCLANDKQVTTHIVADTIPMPTNSYFALSLILNEWITNSIKYASTGEEALEITISVINEPTNVCISYYDNGTIIPAKVTHTGLGTQIVTLLSKQLNARLSTIHNHPYHYQLSIPYA